MKRVSSILAVACGLSMVATVALAEADPPRQPQRPYGGVTRDGGEPPVVKQPPEGLQYLTWPGFRADAKLGAEVFLQLTGPVAHKLRARGRRVEVTLQGTQVLLRNNLRWVITRTFPGPVTRFRLRKLKGDRVLLEIRLSKRSTPTVSTDTKGKFTYLVVHFPPVS